MAKSKWLPTPRHRLCAVTLLLTPLLPLLLRFRSQHLAAAAVLPPSCCRKGAVTAATAVMLLQCCHHHRCHHCHAIAATTKLLPPCRRQAANEKIRPWIPAFLTYILRFCQEGGVYKRYFWASASSETCAPGGSYFVYSVFLGVTLAFLMHSLRITLR
jgi:hypothetical protein